MSKKKDSAIQEVDCSVDDKELSKVSEYGNEKIKVDFKNIDIEKYAQLIENLASTKDSMPFFNSGKDHAAIVMSNIFKYSKKDVRIFAGNFGGEISSQNIYLDSLKGFLERGGVISIILEAYKRENNPKLFDLLHYYKFFKPTQVSVKQTSVKVGYADENTFHFTTGDNSIYRLEEDIVNFSATGSFNDPKETTELIDLFKEIEKDYSTTVDIN